MSSEPQIKEPMSFNEFFDYYLAVHSHRSTRWLHALGTAGGILILVIAIATQRWLLLPVALVVGYGPAWITHALIEHNQPATFKHPLWSILSDFKMTFLLLTGKI